MIDLSQIKILAQTILSLLAKVASDKQQFLIPEDGTDLLLSREWCARRSDGQTSAGVPRFALQLTPSLERWACTCCFHWILRSQRETGRGKAEPV
jgi:hypothetical protein